jgi:FAD/FMN-containing dehydrogenase
VIEPGSGSGLPVEEGGTVLPYGNGRSYGDVCTTTAGTLVGSRKRREILEFDPEAGVLRAEAGILLSEILDSCVPRGWFLPVTPGTKYVTLGGAVANDVHGKNHHVAGTFGCHVRALRLVRSDGTAVECGPGSETEWFRATVGGLGLTGLIDWVEIQLRPISSRTMNVESVRFDDLAGFFDLSRELDEQYDYTVSWIDCLAGGSRLGRGWWYGGRHADAGELTGTRRRRAPSFFIEPPLSLVNRLSLRAFNALYYRRRLARHSESDYDPFFYPLDAVGKWNRLYGPRGFYQFQCVVPPDAGEEAVGEILRQIGDHGQGSFLAVLKQFGDIPSPGLLSFPRPGPTLALDFPNRGRRTLNLLERLEAVTMEAGGALYPAKDACMSPETFRRSFPRWEELEALRDPAVESDFWNRVTGRPEPRPRG